MVRFFNIFFFILSVSQLANAQNKTKLSDGWEFCKSDFSSIWEVVRYSKKGSPESVPKWEAVTIPHCYNAFDAVDPEVNYY
jgi:beta-galactosidase